MNLRQVVVQHFTSLFTEGYVARPACKEGFEGFTRPTPLPRSAEAHNVGNPVAQRGWLGIRAPP